jgi:hypothetical protein
MATMRAPSARFRPSVYGDAGGAGRSTDLSPTDAWVLANANRILIDDAGYVFLVFPGTGSGARIQVLYRPDGSQPGKVYAGSEAAFPRVVEALRAKGRVATQAELDRYKAMATSGSTAAAPTSTFQLPTVTASAPAAQPGSKPKKRKRKAMVPFYQQAWFSYAAGGVALLLLLGIGLTVRSARRRTETTAGASA